MARTDEAAIVARGARGHTQRLSYRVDALHRRPLQHLSPANTRPRRQVQPRTKVLARRKTRQVSTKLRKDRQRRLSPNRWNGRQVDAQDRVHHPLQGTLTGQTRRRLQPPLSSFVIEPRPLRVSTICSSAARI